MSNSGQSLRPWQSTRVDKPKYADRLFNDFLVHHLHLSLDVPGQRFVPRADEIAFVLVDQARLLVIDVVSHPRDGEPTWSDDRMVAILDADWPEAIANALDRGGLRGETASAADREAARRGGVVTPVILPSGRTYWPVGGGYSTDGSSAVARSDANYLMADVRKAEAACRTQAKEFVDAARERGHELQRLELRLEVGENQNGEITMIAVETQSGVRVVLRRVPG